MSKECTEKVYELPLEDLVFSGECKKGDEKVCELSNNTLCDLAKKKIEFICPTELVN